MNDLVLSLRYVILLFYAGDALHYSWFVNHDVPGLIALHPSPEAFDEALQSFFVNHLKFTENIKEVLPNPYYWAGNEHSFMVPWLFNYGPDCTNTQ